MRPSRFAPSASALLLIDVQECFRSMAEPIIGRFAPLVAALRQAGVPIFFTRHGHQDRAADGGMLAEWWDHHPIEDLRFGVATVLICADVRAMLQSA